MNIFARVDKVAGVLGYLGEVKIENVVNRKSVNGLTEDTKWKRAR